MNSVKLLNWMYLVCKFRMYLVYIISETNIYKTFLNSYFLKKKKLVVARRKGSYEGNVVKYGKVMIVVISCFNAESFTLN